MSIQYCHCTETGVPTHRHYPPEGCPREPVGPTADTEHLDREDEDVTTGSAAKAGGTGSANESGGRSPGHGIKLPQTGRAGRRQKGERSQGGYGAARAPRTRPVPHPLAAPKAD